MVFVIEFVLKEKHIIQCYHYLSKHYLKIYQLSSISDDIITMTMIIDIDSDILSFF